MYCWNWCENAGRAEPYTQNTLQLGHCKSHVAIRNLQVQQANKLGAEIDIHSTCNDANSHLTISETFENSDTPVTHEPHHTSITLELTALATICITAGKPSQLIVSSLCTAVWA